MHVVDVHSHVYPRWYLDALRETEPPVVVGAPGDERFVIFAGELGRSFGREWWELYEKLAFMDAVGITQTVASLGNPWLDPFSGEAATDLAARVNEYFSGLEEASGGRVVGMGVLPQHDVALAAQTVREIASRRRLYGVINGCRLCGLELDDRRLEPIWSELAAAELPLFLHPHYVVGFDALRGRGHAFPVALGFPFETTVALARFVFAGILRRHPTLRVVAAHGGGTIPFLAGRLDAGWQSDPSVREELDVPPSRDLRAVFYDALVYHPPALRALSTFVGVDRIAFGTDHPFSVADPAANLRAVDDAFGDDDREAVLAESARTFFGLPQPVRS